MKHLHRNTYAQSKQQKHWESLGQICRCLGLLTYVLDSDKRMSNRVRMELEQARKFLMRARQAEFQERNFK